MENPAETIKNNISPKKKGSSSKFLVISLILLLVGALIGTYYFYDLSIRCGVSKASLEQNYQNAIAQQPEKKTGSKEWVETSLMGSYTFEYPFGWHVANLWPDDYSDPITIAVHPSPVNTAPRGGPLAEITILDKSGMEKPDEYFNERVAEAEAYFEYFNEEIIDTDFGKVNHYTGKINLFGEMQDAERYLFKIQGGIDDNINTHVIEVSGNPFSTTYSEILKKLVLSFKRVK